MPDLAAAAAASFLDHSTYCLASTAVRTAPALGPSLDATSCATSGGATVKEYGWKPALGSSCSPTMFRAAFVTARRWWCESKMLPMLLLLPSLLAADSSVRSAPAAPPTAAIRTCASLAALAAPVPATSPICSCPARRPAKVSTTIPPTKSTGSSVCFGTAGPQAVGPCTDTSSANRSRHARSCCTSGYTLSAGKASVVAPGKSLAMGGTTPSSDAGSRRLCWLTSLRYRPSALVNASIAVWWIIGG
mmetsp:Transcript_357/g.919  ORF Transcript_357/g.919 Transcript_357/m.919 type:complete len:247 (+) Transcript_357:101-841(+)